MTVHEIASLLNAKVEGDGERQITSANSLEMATESQLAFVEGKGAEKAAAESQAGCLLAGLDMPPLDERTLIRVPKPRNAFARVLRVLHPPVRPAPGVHPSAVVAESAVLGEGVSIGAHSVIGESVRIGDNTVVANGVSIAQGSTLGSDCWVHPGVVVYPSVSIGDRVILHAGCVLGADGFGYAREEGHWEKFPQIGTVRIGNDVEIGAHSCVDRAALMVTVIGDGAKLDNMVHIGHNCCIGRHVVIAAQTGLSGGVIVEDYAVIGGQVGVGDKARIESHAVLGSGCGVLPSKVVRSGQTVWGTPARPRREYLERLALLGRLPKIAEELKALAQRVSKLESK